MTGNFMEVVKHSSMRHWSNTGPNRPVKVVSPAAEKALSQHGMVSGYITQEKFLIGKTCDRIERDLGLRPFELRNQCYIYSLERLPTSDEVEFKLSCDFPDGRVFSDESYQKASDARVDYLENRNTLVRSMTPVYNYYPPGSGRVLQWRLISSVPIDRKIAVVTRVLPFTKQNGLVR